jgi:alpha-beta hydrolase superfamily lysophospholipase
MAVMVLERSSWIIGAIAVRLGRFGLVLPRRAPAPPARKITLESEDGLEIAATYWPGRRPDSPALLIVHGFMASQKAVQPNAEWFAGQGYAVLTIDLRGHGRSSNAPCGFGWSESRDVRAGFAWLKQQQAGAKVGIIGISMGGAAALLGPNGPVPADAMVLQAVFSNIHHAIRNRIALLWSRRFARRFEPLLTAQVWSRTGVKPAQLDPIAIVPKLRCPLLVIGGERDGFTPPDETRALYDAASEPKGLLLMRDLGHHGVSNTPDPIYRERVLSFMRETIGPPET